MPFDIFLHRQLVSFTPHPVKNEHKSVSSLTAIVNTYLNTQGKATQGKHKGHCMVNISFLQTLYSEKFAYVLQSSSWNLCDFLCL